MELDVFRNFFKDLNDLGSFKDYLQYQWTIQPQFMQNIRTRTKTINKQSRFDPLTDLTEREFQNRYRFTKENMRKIIEMVRDDLEVETSSEVPQRSNQVPVELQVMAAIRYWGRSESMEKTARRHEIKKRTLAKISRRVSAALAFKASRYIRMPATFAEKQCVTNAFQALAGMPNVIGALAHTAVGLNRNKTGDYENEYDADETQIHIQIVSDASLKIRDIDCKVPADDHELNSSKMFAHSRIKERFEQNEFRGRILVGNENFTCASYLFTPVEGPIVEEEKSYNRSHVATLAPALNCLKFWLQRFGILEDEIRSSQNTAKHIIVALALLHNMAIEWNDPSLVSDSCQAHGGDVNKNNENTDARAEFIKHNF